MLLRVDQGKGGRDREVPLIRRCSPRCGSTTAGCGPDVSLPGTQDGWRADRPITTKPIWEAVRLAAAARPDREARHAAHAETFVRDASAGAGRGPPYIQLLLGHADLSHTTVYLHLFAASTCRRPRIRSPSSCRSSRRSCSTGLGLLRKPQSRDPARRGGGRYPPRAG